MARFGFTVTATRNKLSGGKATYAAHVQHLDVLRGKSLQEEMASYFAMNSTLAGNLLNGLRGFIEHKLKAGYKLDFGVFKVGLSIRGGFDAVNDDFDATRNSVGVTFSPGVELQKSVAKLRPENLSVVAEPVLKSVYGLYDGAKKSEIVCGKTCGANGVFPNVDFAGDGDGLWLEDAAGNRVADAKIVSRSVSRIDFAFEGPLAASRYRLVVGFHDGGAAIATSALSVTVC